MAVRKTKNITTGKAVAERFRKRGFDATVYKVKGGKTRVSITRGIKKKVSKPLTRKIIKTRRLKIAKKLRPRIKTISTSTSNNAFDFGF